MPPENERSRPEARAATSKQTQHDSTTTIPTEQLAGVEFLSDGVTVGPDHVLVVVGVRRRSYFNLPSAVKALQRARSRGELAELVLCRLVPVGGAR